MNKSERDSWASRAVEQIDEKTPRRKDRPRQYIGASGIGNRCSAAIAFALRGFPDDPPDPQLLRIFNLGSAVEGMIVADLRAAGFNVIEVDPMTGKQWNYNLLGGHIRCNLDGLMEAEDGETWNVEIKTMNDGKWNKFVEAGVSVSHPNYYDQMQMQMAMSKTRFSLFVAYNKNNSRYHIEVVPFDEMAWGYLESKIEDALLNRAQKISDTESDWRCRGCFKRSACWASTPVTPECRYCQHASAEDGYRWHCHLHNMEAAAPCESFERYRPLEKGATT